MRRTSLTILLLAIALVAAVFVAVLFGSERLPFYETVCSVLVGNCGLTSEQTAILFEIRFPRVLLGATVGAALATAGASYQSLLRNPLAEPYLLGVSNGAALGTMLALVFFGNFTFSRPVFAFFGAIASTLVVYSLARSRAGMNTERLVLAGVIVTTFLSSLIVLMTSL